MNMKTNGPNFLVENLLAKASHPLKRRNLELIHIVCEQLHNEGARDFSIKNVGNIVEARGGPKVKTLSNPQSADYRKVLEAWQAHSGLEKKAVKEGTDLFDVVLRNIQDPAMRIMVERLIQERDSLRAEVNILKAQANLVIDMRPVMSSKREVGAGSGNVMLEVSQRPVLNSIERESLEHAISDQCLRSEGWRAEKNGRVVKDLGDQRVRTVFKPGFIGSIRKILDM